MSAIFRDFLRKIGSGSHTGKDLTRAEAEIATRLLLGQEATPAQIGAFLIAHRIKRPTGEELAGMLDAYAALGPQLAPVDPRQFATSVVTVMGSPYDGRSRTVPLSLLSALVLTAAGYPVVLHGGDRMPTKQGTPLVEFWQGLGVDWTVLSLEGVQQRLNQIGIGFIYLPNHFPLAHALVPYRDQIGKRPPLATLELVWVPYSGPHHLVSGFVHPPTEQFMREALALRGTACFTAVKGLEGSCDLPRGRTAILGLAGNVGDLSQSSTFERLCLDPRDYDLSSEDVSLTDTTTAVEAMQSVLKGQPSELLSSAVWSSGFYLWRNGATSSLEAGLGLARTLLNQGKALAILHHLQNFS
jgi:anthranilate phosphoribosyltransferase